MKGFKNNNINNSVNKATVKQQIFIVWQTPDVLLKIFISIFKAKKTQVEISHSYQRTAFSSRWSLSEQSKTETSFDETVSAIKAAEINATSIINWLNRNSERSVNFVDETQSFVMFPYKVTTKLQESVKNIVEFCEMRI